MQLTGEITSGAIAIIVTILGGILSFWLKSSIAGAKMDLLIKSMQTQIETNKASLEMEMKTNRESFLAQFVDMRGEFKAQNKSIEDMKLQLAAISAQQNMMQMFKTLPEDLARSLGELRGRRYERNRDDHDVDHAR